MVGYWGGIAPDNLISDGWKHIISIDTAWLTSKGYLLDKYLTLLKKIDTPEEYTIKSTTEEAFIAASRSGIRLSGEESDMLPPMSAIVQSRDKQVDDWLSSLKLSESEALYFYSEIQNAEPGASYTRMFNRTLPLLSQDSSIAAVLGGWHVLWPSEKPYRYRREERLVLFTLWEAEPWIEMRMNEHGSLAAFSRITG